MENKLTEDMKRFLLILAAAVAVSTFCFAGKPGKKAERRAVYATTMHCAKCAEKIKENVSFEKGVSDLQVTLADKTVAVVYNPAKTDTLNLRKAINRLGFKAKLISDKTL